MESFIKKIISKNIDAESKRYFLRFGKGNYRGRFLLSFDKGADKVKVRGSYEMANNFVKFVNEIKENGKFSGKIFMKDKVPGKIGRKKAGVFAYEVSDCNISEYPNAYYYLLDTENPGITLKIKKSLPKPGQDEQKIDDKFCSMDLDLKYLQQVKEAFFWDVPECKKALVEHEIIVNAVEMPKGEKDPVKIRENSIRKGKIIRKINIDGKDIVKEHELVV